MGACETSWFHAACVGDERARGPPWKRGKTSHPPSRGGLANVLWRPAPLATATIPATTAMQPTAMARFLIAMIIGNAREPRDRGRLGALAHGKDRSPARGSPEAGDEP